MSRAFHPPDTLSKEDIRTVADVRRQIWTSGFKGMAFGSLTGYALHTAAKQMQTRHNNNMNKAKGAAASKSTTAAGGGAFTRTLLSGVNFSRNTATLSFLLGGALGAFVMASTAGKNQVHNLYPVFEVGKSHEDRGTRYQNLVMQARHIEEMKEREERRLQRRESLQENFYHGHGLSDSHGGHWVQQQQQQQQQQEEDANARTN